MNLCEPRSMSHEYCGPKTAFASKADSIDRLMSLNDLEEMVVELVVVVEDGECHPSNKQCKQPHVTGISPESHHPYSNPSES